LSCMRTNKRLESIKVLVNEMLLTIENTVKMRESCIHLYGVSAFASMLAMKRGQNPELAEIAGLLHDYYVYKTGINEFPGSAPRL
jgi:HD superfamily phosphodiesterase